ncbi:MAG TPA: hypothetical protein PLP21_09155 [Pyrinomonadaceae bacterium]|nr:hypothetical protein [Acidobacteriota bacterium]HQZ96474.1 hypothetical protein [Pyrinomonadaceae bacterium]
MDHNGFAELLDQLARSWSSKSYEEVASRFTERLYYSDAINYSFFDRESLLDFFRDDGGHEQSCVFHDHVFDVGRQIGVAEYTYSGHYIYHGTVWIELEGDMISVWREYQHRADTSYESFWKLDERDHP